MPVLLFSGVEELIFFMEVWFGFVLGAGLINTRMFELLLSSAHTKLFLLLLLLPLHQQSRLGVQEKLGRETGGTADSS